MDIEKVGKAIAYLRKKAGYTQKDLADRIGISDKAVSKWERGLGLPDIAYISKLAVILDTDAEALLAGDVIHHDKGWNGLLILQDNPYGIGASTLLYDKPLVYFLLSKFLLVGIKTIYIVCEQKDAKYIESYFGNGSRLGINIYYVSLLYEDIQDVIDSKMNCSNVMVVHGPTLIYGADLTRVFQRAMSYRDQIRVLSLPRDKTYANEKLVTLDDNNGAPISFNKNKKVVGIESDERVITKYKYYPIPVLFCPKRVIYDIIISGQDGNVSINTIFSITQTLPIFIETLNRGYFEMQINTPDDVVDASNFIKVIQKSSGMAIDCVEEIALNRGMISQDEIKITTAYKS